LLPLKIFTSPFHGGRKEKEMKVEKKYYDEKKRGLFYWLFSEEGKGAMFSCYSGELEEKILELIKASDVTILSEAEKN
jgi:hypothetical protein